MVALPLPRSTNRRSVQNRLAQSHVVQWRTASPLWSQIAAQLGDRTIQQSAAFKQPAILRFTTDSFMEDFLAIAENAPQRLGEWQAQWETWREPAPVPALPQEPSSLPGELFVPATDNSLKLYQPAHQRYYLVSANLVCRVAGFPDKTLKLGEEKVSFVLRRKLEMETGQLQEHAFVDGYWKPLNGKALMPGEERFPLFPTTYQVQDNRQRRMFSGLIPVGERERYLNAPRQPVEPRGNLDPLAQQAEQKEALLDQLMMVLVMDVLFPWKELIAQVGDYSIEEVANEPRELLTRTISESLANINSAQAQQFKDSLIAQRGQLQFNSWYILLDLANFIATYLPSIWDAITSKDPAALSPQQRSLYVKLNSIKYQRGNSPPLSAFRTQSANNTNDIYELLIGQTPGNRAVSLTEALLSVKAKEAFLEETTEPFDPSANPNNNNWPSTEFLLSARGMQSHLEELGDRNPTTQEIIQAGLFRQALAEVPNLLNQAVPQVPQAQAVSQSAKASDRKNTTFTIRCVYERPNCPPSIHPTIVSDPTKPFELAAYYDPDAPTRPIRIAMPVDTTPSGLRKYAKNTAFVISDTLGCQINQASSVSFGDLVRSVLPWPFHKDLDTSSAKCQSSGSLDFGKMMMLSIPIITLCALLLLMMIVKLLDIIFRWVPLFIVWVPIPGLKAKEKK